MAVSKAAKATSDEKVVTIDRRRGSRRQSEDGGEARKINPPRPKKKRRRHIDPTTCERDYNNAEIEFMRAMDDYKRDSGRMFPTCSEVLEVIRSLGYFQLSDDQIDTLQLDTSPPAGDADADADADGDADAEFDDDDVEMSDAEQATLGA